MKLKELLEGLNLLEHTDKIKGGLADDSSPDEFDQNELKMGIEIEMEHTDDRDVAKEIAMDHLKEIPDYYTRLKKMEKETLNETLKVNPATNEISYSHQTKKTPREKNVIDTYLDLEMVKLKSQSKQYSGDIVYSAFKYDTKAIKDKDEVDEFDKNGKKIKKPADETMTQMLKAIKGQPSIYTFDNRARERLLNDVAIYINKRLVWTKDYKIDYIIYPKSTSSINKDLAHKLGQLSKVQVMDDVLMKKKIGDNLEEVASVLDSYFYKDEAIAAIGEKRYTDMKKSIIRAMKNNNTLDIIIKKISPPQNRKYLKNLLKFEKDVEYLRDKNVLVIDDILSTGKTMQDALELVRNAGAKRSIGFTIFKY